jgi:ATP-dependent RNA helicase DHR2
MSRPLFDDGFTRTITTPLSGKVRNVFSHKPAAASQPEKSNPEKSKPEKKSKKRAREEREGQHEEEVKPAPKGILKKPDGSKEEKKPNGSKEEEVTEKNSTEVEKPLSNRERKKREKAAAWAALIAQREKEKASDPGAAAADADGSPAPKPAAAPKPAKPAEMTDIEFIARKRARREAGSGLATANEKKRRKKEEAFPLLNGAPAPRVLVPKKDAGKEEPKKGAGKDCPSTTGDGAAPQVHSAQLKMQAAALAKTRSQLPIYPHAESLRQCLRDRDVLVMLGETGSGKSTQIGQFLVDEPWRNGKCIAITQPRKVAAVNLARRVAAEMGVRLGEEVGYSVRFDNKSSEKTRIKFLTDGMLLQEMLADPKLRRYSCVVVDEAHERTVGTDLVMGFLRALVYGERRGNLKVVIMSATLEVEAMARFFEENRGEGIEITGLPEEETPTETTKQEAEETEETEARSNIQEPDKKKKKKKKKKDGIDTMALIRSPSPIPERIKTPETTVVEGATLQTEEGQMVLPYFGSVALFHVPGRQYAVEAFHSQEPVDDYVNAALKTVFTIHYSEPFPGDILVFLTGQDEIENLRKTILEYAANLPREQPKVRIYTRIVFISANPASRCTSSLYTPRSRSPNRTKSSSPRPRSACAK